MKIHRTGWTLTFMGPPSGGILRPARSLSPSPPHPAPRRWDRKPTCGDRGRGRAVGQKSPRPLKSWTSLEVGELRPTAVCELLVCVAGAQRALRSPLRSPNQDSEVEMVAVDSAGYRPSSATLGLGQSRVSMQQTGRRRLVLCAWADFIQNRRPGLRLRARVWTQGRWTRGR